MTSRKLNLILIGALGLLGLALIGGAYGANSMLKAQAKDLLDQKTQSIVLAEEEKQLTKDKKDIASYSDLNSIAKSIVPQDKDQAEAVREIVNIAAASHIPHLNSVSFPASALGGAASSSTQSNLTQLTPVKGIAGVYSLPITVQVTAASAVPYSTFITFLEHLEHNRRTSQVSNITVTPNTTNPSLVAFTLVIDEYIKP